MASQLPPIWRCGRKRNNDSGKQPFLDLGKEALLRQRESVRGEHFRKKGQRRGGIARPLDQAGPFHKKCLGPDGAGRSFAGHAKGIENADLSRLGGVPAERVEGGSQDLVFRQRQAVVQVKREKQQFDDGLAGVLIRGAGNTKGAWIDNPISTLPG